MIGLLYLGRAHPDPFVDEDLHRAKAVAFSAAAAIRKAQLLEQVHRYAALMEQVVEVDQRVFAGVPLDEVARAILDGAGKVGSYKGGLLILQSPRGPVVAAATGEGLAGAVGRPAPPDLAATAARRLPASRIPEVAEALGVTMPAQPMFLVPLNTADGHVGTLALLDPDGETPDDRLMEAYGSRTAAAYRHAAARLERAEPAADHSASRHTADLRRFDGTKRLFVMVAALLGSSEAMAAKTDVYAIVGARVVTVSGAVLESATVILRDGVIERVGRGRGAARRPRDRRQGPDPHPRPHRRILRARACSPAVPRGAGTPSGPASSPTPSLLAPQSLALDRFAPRRRAEGPRQRESRPRS